MYNLLPLIIPRFRGLRIFSMESFANTSDL